MVNAGVAEVEVSPENPVQGDVVKILIKAGPEEEVSVTISFTKKLQVSDGKFEYRIDDVVIPSTPNSFTAKAVNVKNIHVSVKFLIWITKSAEAENGIATVSQSNVPKGTYDIRIRGYAVEDASTISLQVTASTKITTDQNGYYEYIYDTSSIPLGTFTAQVGGITKTIALRKIETPPTTPPSPPTSEELEEVPAEEAAEALEELSTEEAAEIIAELDVDKGAAIIEELSTEKATAILLNISINKSAAILQKVSAAKAADIVMEAVDKGSTVEVSDILLAVEEESAASVIIEIQPASAAPVVESMVEKDVRLTALIIEAAVEIDVTSTSEVLEEVETDVLANLLIETARLPSTPSTVAAVFEVLNLEKVLEVVKSWIPREALQELGSVFGYLMSGTLNNIYGGLKVEERAMIYPYLSPETLAVIASEVLPLPDPTTTQIMVSGLGSMDFAVSTAIKNQGNVDSGPFNVFLKAGSSLIDQTEVPSLSANASTTVTFEWRPTSTGSYTLEVAIDPDGLVEEIDETNNIAQATVTVESKEASFPWTLTISAVMAVLASLAVLYFFVKSQS